MEIVTNQYGLLSTFLICRWRKTKAMPLKKVLRINRVDI